MSKLTGTHSEAASYEFTTLTTVPGTLMHNGARLQVLDLPGIIEGAKDGKGRGRQVIAVARTCNLIFIVLDVLKPLNDLAIITNELEGFGIRLNKKPPAITVKKRETGGIAITNTVPLTKVDAQEIKAVLSEYRLNSAAVTIHQPDATIEDIIDVVEGNRVYVPAIHVLNKIDAISIEELDLLYKIPHSVPISSKMWLNIDELKEFMWERLDLVRVYTKPRGQVPDYSSPVVLRRSKCTVEDFCNAIHKEIVKQFRNGACLFPRPSVSHTHLSNGLGHICQALARTKSRSRPRIGGRRVSRFSRQASVTPLTLASSVSTRSKVLSEMAPLYAYTLAISYNPTRGDAGRFSRRYQSVVHPRHGIRLRPVI